MAGLTTTGISIDTLDEILAAIEADELTTIDPGLNMNPDDVLGQINGVIAGALAPLHELMEELYQSAYADTATGQALSYIAALTGTIRRAATKAATSQVTFEGVDGTTIPAGSQWYVQSDPDSVFASVEEITIGPSTAEVVDCEATVTGPGPRCLTTDTPVIATPISGWTGVSINFDSVDGKLEETDAELRLRREQSLAQAGASTVEAIRADMLTVRGVDTCTVFENPTGVTDADGVPPFAIEVLVFSSGAPTYTAQDVVDQIFLSKPAGTEAHGSLSGTATDSLGNTHSIKYSEPTTVRTWVDVTLAEAPGGAYVDDAAVAQAIEDWAAVTLRVGQDVYASDIINVVADLPGVLSVDVTQVFVDNQASPVSVDLITQSRELATIDAADVTITST